MRPRQARNLAVLLTSMVLLAFGFNNCGQRTRMSTRDPVLLANASVRGGGSTGGNPAMTTLRFSSYTEPSKAAPKSGSDGAAPPPIFNPLLLSFFSICASSVQFYPADGTQPIERSLDRDMLLLADGTPISDFKVPFGSYRGIVIKIADTCGSGRSFEFTNAAGTVHSTEETTMAFAGNFRAGNKDIVLTLGIFDIVAALAETTTEDAARNSINLPSVLLPLSDDGEKPGDGRVPNPAPSRDPFDGGGGSIITDD